MPAPATPAPTVAPSPRVSVGGSYALAAGQGLYVKDPTGGGGIRLESVGGAQLSVSIAGTYWAESTTTTLVTGITVHGVSPTPTIAILTSGKVYVTGLGDAYGARLVSGARLTNDGLIQVTSRDEAVGVISAERNETFVQGADGTLRVHGVGAAEGLVTGLIDNAGTIDVSVDAAPDGSLSVATAVLDPESFLNTGTVLAHSDGAVSIAVAISKGTRDLHYRNFGTIIGGDYAFFQFVDAAGAWSPVYIDNTGVIVGDISLGQGMAVVTNSGVITGRVEINHSLGNYLGAAGTLAGVLVIGGSGGQATLGQGGEAVLVRSGTASITGGAGDDVFEVQGGAVSLQGGLGVNTLTFASQPAAVNVDMAAGKATGINSTVNFSSIQNVVGSEFADQITGGGGDDYAFGSGGNDSIDLGGGWNTAAYEGAEADYQVTRAADGSITVVDLRGGSPDGTDQLRHVQTLSFLDGDVVLGPASPLEAVEIAFSKVLREPTPTAGHKALHDSLVAQAAGWTTMPTSAVDQIVDAADATSSVATLAYQFFTGRAPGAGGMDYLVALGGPNPNSLNSAYYQSFNLENRYINFAVNLGRDGAGRDAFKESYGQLSLFEATRKAYAEIFGEAPSDAKLHALLDPSITLGGQTFTRAAYFAAYGGDGPNGQGTKAAMVGFLLAEAVKADLGMYALANEAFLADVAVNNAPFAVDIVGTYGDDSFIYHPG